MDRHSTLNDSLNASCEKSKLTSWTKHVNQRGTVYAIRFAESSAILDPNDPDKSNPVKHIIYKPKSRYHINRDFARMGVLNDSNSFVRPNDNSTFGDISHVSDFHHSKPDQSNVNNKSSQAEPNVSDAAKPHESMLCSDASTHTLPHDPSINVASIVKHQHHASEILVCPPVECESIDVIHPLVQCEATEYLHADKLYHACSHLPTLQPPAKLISVSDVLSSEPRTDSSYTDIHYNPVSDFDFSFESQPKLEQEIDFHPNTCQDYSTPVGYVAKTQYSKDILCNLCSTSVPNSMIYCDTCVLHICDNCLTRHNYSHSLSCHGNLHYMNESDMHLQRVPDSKNNSILADSLRPPGIYETFDDQKVPKTKEELELEIRTMLDGMNAQLIDSLETTIGNSFDKAFSTQSSFSSRFGK